MGSCKKKALFGKNRLPDVKNIQLVAFHRAKKCFYLIFVNYFDKDSYA
jgi:hypothetical protein